MTCICNQGILNWTLSSVWGGYLNIYTQVKEKRKNTKKIIYRRRGAGFRLTYKNLLLTLPEETVESLKDKTNSGKTISLWTAKNAGKQWIAMHSFWRHLQQPGTRSRKCSAFSKLVNIWPPCRFSRTFFMSVRVNGLENIYISYMFQQSIEKRW